MHIRRGFLGWGVFLILAGAVPLAVRSGYLSEDQVGRLWTLWPLILVGIGVGLILSRTRFDFLGGIIVAATFGLMVGGLLSSGIGTFSTGACGQTGGTTAFPSRDGTFASSSGSIDVQIELRHRLDRRCARAMAGASRARTPTGSGPDIEATDATVRVRPRDDGGKPFWVFAQRDTWRITIPQAVTTDVDLQLNAGQANVDLSGALIGDFGLQLNAGSATVDLECGRGRSIGSTSSSTRVRSE